MVIGIAEPDKLQAHWRRGVAAGARMCQERAMTPRYAPRLIAIIVAAAMFMGSLDQTVIATALPQMARAFHRPPVDLSLAMTIYILVMAAFLPVSTWVADRLGARKVFAGAIAGGAAASARCGFTHSLPEFIGARR